jgi:hypothetical protein
MFVCSMGYLNPYTITLALLALALVSRSNSETLHDDRPAVPDYVTRYGMRFSFVPEPLSSKMKGNIRF